MIEKSRSPLIQIIIPNWNGAKMLAHCLDSLKNQSFSDFKVTVVDNGSSDESLALLQQEYQDVDVISLDHNSGFSIAVNLGIQQASGEWILLLNNDMEVAPDCLEHLVKGVSQYDEDTFFALKMMSFHQRETIDGAGDAFLRGGVGYRIGTLEKDCKAYQHDRRIFGACAGAALYHHSLFEKIGLFDEDFFAYLEDVDLNLRAARHGMNCMFLSKAVVYHIGSATSGSKINPLTIRLSTRNNLSLLTKNYPISYLLRFFLPVMTFQFMWLLFCIKKKMLLPYMQGIFQAVKLSPLFYKKRKKLQEEFPLTADNKQQLAAILIWAEREAVESIKARRHALGKSNSLLDIYSWLFLPTENKVTNYEQ